MVKIKIDDVSAIGNLGEDGALFYMVGGPDEHIRVPFVEALGAYCDAVDQGLLAATIVEEANP